MSLLILDSEYNTFDGNLITNHNSFTGGEDVKLLYLKNEDPQVYYSGIRLEPIMPDLIPGDLFSSSGWSVKMIYGASEPTEKEWDLALINGSVSIPDIGDETNADTATYKPVWIRVFCPGHTEPQIKKDISLRLYFSEKVVLGNA